MSIQHVELTSALRPELQPEELLLFIQDSVGLYEEKEPLAQYQAGHVYLTSHRICYVDDEKPREASLAVDLKDVVKHEVYAGFLKSSPKITLHLKQRGPTSSDSSPRAGSTPSRSYNGTPQPSTPASTRASTSIARPPITGSWICPVCSFSNPIPISFDPSLVDASTPRPPCSSCGVKPQFPVLLKAAISAAASRYDEPVLKAQPAESSGEADTMLDMHEFLIDVPKAASRSKVFQRQACPVCTFENHPSMTACEMCGTALQPRGPSLVRLQPAEVNRGASPILDGNMKTKGRMLSRNPESIKLSFRAGGEKPFLLKLREALVQRKWILKNAPDISLARTSTSSPYPSSTPGSPVSSIPPTKPQNVGIASILAQNEQTRLKTQTIIGDAFADLEHLMASAKEVIDLAESFQRMNPNNNDPSSPSAPNTNTLDPTQALSLLGLRNNDPSRSSTASATAYTHSLARTLSDFLTSSSPHPLLHREGGIITLVDLWAVFNRARGGVALVSPQELRDAVECFEALKLPVRVRRFKSGLLAVRGVEWGDGRVVERILGVIGDAGSGEGERLGREAVERVAWRGEVQGGEDGPAAVEGEEEERQGRERQLLERFGVGITAQQLASRLGWSVGVADEELAMAEERGAVCREEGVEGVRWWVNHFLDDYG